MESKNNPKLLKYDLSPNYFIPKQTYFQKFQKESTAKLQTYFKLNTFYKSNEFIERIKNENLLCLFYDDILNKLKKEEKIPILEHGFFFYDRKFLLYVKKDEHIMDNYLMNIKYIKPIEHKVYDPSIPTIPINKYENNQKALSSGNTIQKKALSDKFDKDDNLSLDSNPMLKEDYMSGIKNRALVLESLVNYYFKKLSLSLPEIIFNLQYNPAEKKNSESINFFYEWDGCFLFKEDQNIFFKSSEVLPFSNEKKYKIFLNDKIEETNDDILLLKNSLNFIEVKTHFPKDQENNENNSLKNVIKTMFIKLNYFVDLFFEILTNDTIDNIKIILLYDQIRLKNYDKIISKYINTYKKLITFKKAKAEFIYFDIIYIIPSISKFVIMKSNTEENLELKNQIQNLKESNEALTKKITLANTKFNEEKNISNIKIKNLELANAKFNEEKNISDIKIKNLELANAKFIEEKNISDIKIKNLELANAKFIEENKKSDVKIKNLQDEIEEIKKLLLELNANKNPKNKLEESENKNNYSKNPNINIKVEEEFSKEMINKINEECKKVLKVENFSILTYKNNHTKEPISSAFHDALKKFNKKARNKFFEKYGLIPCMSVCPKLLDSKNL